MKNIKYAPTILNALCNFVFLIIVIVLFLGRKSNVFKIDALLDLQPDFYLHVSNFSISYILFSGIGYMWLLFGVQFRYIIGLGIAMAAVNFAYELWIPVLNTPDIIDAYYGFGGILAAFLFLLLTKKYGLKYIQMNV